MQEEYIFGDSPLIQFLYVQDRLSRGEVPTCVIKFVEDVYVFTSNTTVDSRIVKLKPTSTLRKKVQHRSSWDIEEKFQITIQAISNCFSQTNGEIGILAGLFHGGKPLCNEKQKTREVIVREGSADWFQTLSFDLSIRDVPRMARLCIVVYETNLSAKNSKHIRARRLKDSQKELFINPIAWANTNVFDYKNQLKTGGNTLYTWTYAEDSDSEEILHPLGTVEPNPRTDECASITMLFHAYDTNLRVEEPLRSAQILYPSEQEMINKAEAKLRETQKLVFPSDDGTSITTLLQPYMQNSRINDISEQESKEIWERRFDCMRWQPDALPCVLYCVEWNDRFEVAEVTRLLQEWPQDKMAVGELL